MVTYHLPKLAAMPVPIRGRYLAHNRYDRIHRAFLAADLFSGDLQLVKPTLTQAALLAGVNRTYAFWATRRQDQRHEILTGRLPLVPASAPKNGHILSIDDVGLFDIVRDIGVERILNIASAVEQAQAQH